MKSVAAILALCGAVCSAEVARVHTPQGLVRAECHHDVPSGSTVAVLDDSYLITPPDGKSYKVDRCKGTEEEPFLLVDSLESATGSLRGAEYSSDDIAPGYNGWLEYTQAYDKSGYDSFTGYFSVPKDSPTQAPEVLYLFTGLQNIPWIPKVDPKPSKPFDIIQPVLQYPGEFGDYWSARSWYVDLDGGSFASSEIKTDLGTNVFGNMTKIGDDKWLVDSVNSQGQHTTIKPQHTRLQSQPYAYVTLECYSCVSCASEPTTPSYFTEMLFTNNQGSTEVEWTANPDPSHSRVCHEGISIQDSATVTVTFSDSE